MTQEKPIDLHKEKPFNLTEILKITDEFIAILESLDIAYPVFSQKIKHLRELKYLYNLVRQRRPKLFTY
jgi:hypothetical protein